MNLSKWWENANQRLFYFQTFFWLGHIGIFTFGYLQQRNDFELRIPNNMGKSVFIARAAGFVLSFDCSLLILSMCRNTMTLLRSTFLSSLVNFEEHKYFHKWVAYSTLLFTIIHTVSHYFNYFGMEFILSALSLSSARKSHYSTYAGLTGHIMVFCMVLMYTAARGKIKQKAFELFWFVHHLFIPFYICVILHSAGCVVRAAPDPFNPQHIKCKSYRSIAGTIPAFLLYCIERFVLRPYRSSLPTKVTQVTLHPGNTLEIRFLKKSFRYNPGQYLFLNVPGVSYLQWHPFTISSSPEEDYASVHIRLCGDWTNQVKDLFLKSKAGAQSSESKSDESSGEQQIEYPKIYVDGPFGTPAEDLTNYKSAILIASGIGVTPAASLLKSVWYKFYHRENLSLKKLYFIWLVRDAKAFSWFQSLLLSLEEKIPPSKLQITMHLTGQQNPDDIRRIVAQQEEKGDLNDAITLLKSRTLFGRPSWAKVFNDIQREQTTLLQPEESLEIGVFFCGPRQLAKVLKDECGKASNTQIQFQLKKEIF